MEYQIISNKGDKTTLCIDDDMTVGDVRGVAAAMLDAPEDRIMTVSLAGKLLTDDAETWAELRSRVFAGREPHPMQRKLLCNLTDRPVTETQSGEVMRMFASKEERKLEKEKERQSTAAMESMVESLAQNPGMLEGLLSMNPQIQKMQKKSPEMARMLKDPEMLKTLLLSSVNPERRKEMERSAELQLAQISAMPGGQQAINHYMDQLAEDGDEGETENERAIRIGTSAPTVTDESHYTSDPTKDANNDPLPNPWAASGPASAGVAAPSMASPFGGFGGFGGLPGGGSGGAGGGFFPGFPAAPPAASAGASAPFFPALGGPDANAMGAMWANMLQGMPAANASAAAPAPPLVSEAAMQSGLATLRDMGFEDEALCREALQAANGDVDAAVDYIAEKQEAEG